MHLELATGERREHALGRGRDRDRRTSDVKRMVRRIVNGALDRLPGDAGQHQGHAEEPPRAAATHVTAEDRSADRADDRHRQDERQRHQAADDALAQSQDGDSSATRMVWIARRIGRRYAKSPTIAPTKKGEQKVAGP